MHAIEKYLFHFFWDACPEIFPVDRTFMPNWNQQILKKFGNTVFHRGWVAESSNIYTEHAKRSPFQTLPILSWSLFFQYLWAACLPWHCTENLIYVFPEMKLCGLVPNSYIHFSVSNLYIPRIGLPIWLQQNRQTNPGDIKIALRYMNLLTGRQNILILFWKWQGRAVSFLRIHKSEPDIYIGFSPALHCSVYLYSLCPN